jgi:DNA-binding CsgD family transcriptional regulator
MGRVFAVLAVAAATATACAAAAGGLENALSVVIYGCVAVFETLVWCLMAFIAMQKRLDAVLVFGAGRGLCTLGTTAGWALGSLVLPVVPTGAQRAVVFLVATGLMLVIALVLFSERDYERLFSQVREGELSMGDLFDLDRRMRGEAEGGRSEKRGRFSHAVEELAARHGLSAREGEVLRCLAMGYGSDRIAETMGVKVNTVRAHTHNVYVKLDVHSREDLMRLVDAEVAKQ